MPIARAPDSSMDSRLRGNDDCVEKGKSWVGFGGASHGSSS